jgi:hypothetical protein
MFFYYQSQWLRGQFMNAQLAGDYKLPVQMDSLFGKWTVDDSGYSCNLPNSGIIFTQDEQATLNELTPDIDTYINEQSAQFILNGVTDGDWDAYVNTLKQMKIEECIAIYQAAYDRLLAKGN